MAERAKKTTITPSPPAAQDGSALLMAVFFMALLAAMGITLLTLSMTNLKLSRATLNNKKAFYLAETGIENGRRTLFDANGGGEEFNGPLAIAAGDDGIIDFDGFAVLADYDGTNEFVDFAGFGDDVPLRATSVLGEGFFAAFLTNDPVDGRTNLTDSNSRVMVTGVGVGPNKSFKVVEVIVEPDILLPPLPLSVLTLLGEQPSFEGGASNSERYHGEDCNLLGGGDPTLQVPIVGTTSDEAESLTDPEMDSPPNKYTSGPYSGDETGANLTDPTDPLVAGTGLGTIDPIWNDCGFLQDLLDRLRDYSTYYCDSLGCALPAVTTSEDIVFADGDLQVGPGYVGSGILVVTGELEILGNSTWTGVVLAIGEGHLTRRGGGNGVISGTTLVANIAGPNGIYGDADDCQPVPDAATAGGVDTDPFGTSHYEVTGGGNSDIDYCSRFLFNGPHSYRVVDFRQL